MNIVPKHLRLSALGLLLLTALLSACVVPVGGYVGGYSEPYGPDDGGWGRGYQVGPPRGRERRPEQSTPHSYRRAPESRSTPSIPTRKRDH
jgi:hypothetical protein